MTKMREAEIAVLHALVFVLLLGACSMDTTGVTGATTLADGAIAPPPAHPEAGTGGGAGGELAQDAGGAGGAAGQLDAGAELPPPPPPCLSNNAQGFAFGPPCVAGGACFASCQLGGAPYVGCIDDAAGVARTCVSSCSICP